MEKSSQSVFKANGEKVIFSKEKLINSLRRAGVEKELINSILRKVEEAWYPDMKTKEIYKLAFSTLKKKESPVAAKYKLKKAIQELGPSGYPFEEYIGEIFKHQGFYVRVGVIVEGHCVKHEVDVVAEKDNNHYMVECKFHSSGKTRCHVKAPLYIQSRFIDIKKAWSQKPGHRAIFHKGWLITNTRFSEDATQYGTCVGLNMISWDFPEKGSLRELIDNSGLHPITCLTTLTKKQKQKLLNKMIVLCKDLCENVELLSIAGVSPEATPRILKEARAICQKGM